MGDDETAKTTAYHTFGSSKEVSTFVDSFLMHRSHDIQQQKHSKSSSNGHVAKAKKKKTKSRGDDGRRRCEEAKRLRPNDLRLLFVFSSRTLLRLIFCFFPCSVLLPEL